MDEFDECQACSLHEWEGCTACEIKAYFDILSIYYIPAEITEEDIKWAKESIYESSVV
jgi:hypothetical protein